ncbi:MAG: endolytic transglycosylase MltG [Coriobacteriia bacterium]|nr:endolytic transglycosylase MltG [Coriobacteriia bacterium]
MPRVRARMGAAGVLLRVAGLAAVVALVAAAVGWWYVMERSEHRVEPGKPVQVEIPSGAGAAEIGELLAERGVVRSAVRFRLEVRRAGAGSGLRAGVYELTTGMSYDAVIERLRSGPPVVHVTLAVPEGFTVEQVASRVETVCGIPAAEFLALAKGGGGRFEAGHPYLADAYQGSLEGYLFPKTYRVPQGAGAEDVIGMLLEQFDKETASLDLRVPESRGMNLHDVVTLASMIERETSVAEERALVSSVIYNRLRKGMRLEIDATIEYVLPGNRFRLRNSDLETDSPYNTYRHDGLPPGAIGNPGLECLKAACEPADTDYIYYVLTGKDGSHTFARTWDEFLAAKRESKRVFGR